MISFADMPARLEAAGLKRISAQRCRQLAEKDPDWPVPMEVAQKVGRVRLFDWLALEPYFRGRQSRQGQRTDRASREPKSEGTPMGYEQKRILITVRVSRHNSEQDQADDALFDELADRLRAVLTDKHFEGIEPSFDAPY